MKTGGDGENFNSRKMKAHPFPTRKMAASAQRMLLARPAPTLHRRSRAAAGGAASAARPVASALSTFSRRRFRLASSADGASSTPAGDAPAPAVVPAAPDDSELVALADEVRYILQKLKVERDLTLAEARPLPFLSRIPLPLPALVDWTGRGRDRRRLTLPAAPRNGAGGPGRGRRRPDCSITPR